MDGQMAEQSDHEEPAFRKVEADASDLDDLLHSFLDRNLYAIVSEPDGSVVAYANGEEEAKEVLAALFVRKALAEAVDEEPDGSNA